MEEKNSIASSQSLATIKEDEPMENQVVHQQEATSGTKETNLGGEVVGESGGRSISVSVAETKMKRKRGRPRKYGNAVEDRILLPPGFSPSLPETCEKRGRGRPRGSRKLQPLPTFSGFPAATGGADFTSYIFTVYPGEDIVSRILSFSQRNPKAVCVLSATGTASRVIIHQPGPSGGILKYEGRFEILSLSGSFVFGEMDGSLCKNGVLSVSLAKPDGRVFGGAVAGSMIAAGLVQLVLASFKQDIDEKFKMRKSAKSSTAARVPGNPELVTVPIQGIRMTGGGEHCATPTSALLEPTNGEAGSGVTVNQNAGGPNVLQSS